MWRKFLVLLLISLLSAPFAPSHTSASDEIPISVMTRNIYLGADVGVALQLIPNFPAAAQFMWDQMRQTDFEKRAEFLAKEFATLKPDVIGIQEATKWVCKKSLFSRKKTIYDFLEILISATKRTNVSYSLIQKDGMSGINTGFSIPAIPKLTVVKDPEIFPSLFGREEAACGFEIADALLVRDELDVKLLQLGNSEYKNHYTVVPVVMEIYRGYTWADLKIRGKTIRVVSTHLESLFDEEAIPHSSVQAEQLIADLSTTKSPLIVMGDFNADPRDPRDSNSPNPGGQPTANVKCQSQDLDVVQLGDPRCNAYWKMLEAGYQDVGPDSFSPKNFTWGASALLNGPDKEREAQAVKMGNPHGFTDRLDYIFVKNGFSIVDSSLFSYTWPEGKNNWNCKIGSTSQKCLPSDHVGLFSVLTISGDSSISVDEPLPDNKSVPWLTYGVIAFLGLLLLLFSWVLYRVIIRPIFMLAMRKSRHERTL